MALHLLAAWALLQVQAVRDSAVQLTHQALKQQQSCP